MQDDTIDLRHIAVVYALAFAVLALVRFIAS